MTDSAKSAATSSTSGREHHEGLLGEDYEAYYEGYYAERIPKREITARQTIQHVRDAWQGGRVSRMLDVGAGEGSLLTQLSQSKLAEALYAVEISGSGVDAIAAKKVPGVVEVKKFDGYHIPYPDKYFDVASAIHVLEHVEHERMFLAELARVAKTLIVEVPLEHTFRVNRSIRLGRPYGHINLYDADTFRNILETSGLNVEFAKTHSNSYAYEVCVSGKIEGAIKFSIRTAALRVIPALAAKIMTYMRIARCVVR